MKEKICIVLTGGTICSLPSASGKNYSDAEKTNTRLTEYYLEELSSPFQNKVEFDVKSLEFDILSENMTVNTLEELLGIFKEIDYNEYKGIIVLHGTDTLAYTSSFLSFALSGIKIPVCLVSSQQMLGKEDENGFWQKNENSNGYANFRASVELIMNGILPNVYVAYRNETGELLVHYGSHLEQCVNASDDFHSRDEMKLEDITNARLVGKAFESDGCLFRSVDKIAPSVLMIEPYTNLDYSKIKLKGVRAIVHGTYHSESVCIGRVKKKYKDLAEKDNYNLSQIEEKDKHFSILYLLKRCEKRGISVFLAPCNKENARYSTTSNACKRGAIPLESSAITLEAAYTKALLGCALKKRGTKLKEFLQRSINFELV